MGKSLKVVPPEGYEIDEDKSTFKEIVFRKKEKQLPKSFEELKDVKGWYVDSDMGGVKEHPANGLHGTDIPARDIWPTRELAEAALAMSQLMQLRKAWIGDWEPDWSIVSAKHCITTYKDKLTITLLHNACAVMSLPNLSIAEQFLDTHRTLLEQAKPLL